MVACARFVHHVLLYKAGSLPEIFLSRKNLIMICALFREDGHWTTLFATYVVIAVHALE